jgi:hypothetical protein
VRLRRPSFRRGALLAPQWPLFTARSTSRWSTRTRRPTRGRTSRRRDALLDGSYSTPLQAGFYFVYPQGWFDITGARIPQSVWQELERQVFRPPGYPAYLALFGREKIFLGDHTAALVGQALLFGSAPSS